MRWFVSSWFLRDTGLWCVGTEALRNRRSWHHLLRRTQTGLAGEISARPVSSGMLVRSGTCAGLVVPGIAVAVLLLRVDKRRTWSVAIVSGWDGSAVMENNSAHVTIKAVSYTH